MRIIPKTAKVKAQFFKNITVPDVIIGLAGLFILLMIFLTNLGIGKYVLMLVVLGFFVLLFVPLEGQRLYLFLVNFVKYLFSIKKYNLSYKGSSSDMRNIIPFKGFDEKYIVYEDYYASVLEVDPREFRLLSGYKQDQIIDIQFGKIIRSISGVSKASIVKIDRKLSFEDYMIGEDEKREQLLKLFEAGSITEEELVVIELIALFHDIGNFEQKNFDYLDSSEQEDSTMASIHILFDDGLLRKITPETKYDNLIKIAIFCHNKDGLPKNIDEKTVAICKIMKDVHKIEELHMLINYPFIDNRIKDYPTSIVYNDFKLFRHIDAKMGENNADNVLVVMSNIFDLNYKTSYALVLEKNYISKITSSLWKFKSGCPAVYK